ncbi:5-methylaminomethyl-2-thiouridylate-methyltransferase [Meredithblackwellia eburnea MCA 4105]
MPQWSPSPPLDTKIFVGLSGGVDSSVTARLLLEQGYENIQPFFMRNWDTIDEGDGSGGCEWEKDFADVERVCRESLGGRKPVLVDLSREYWQDVFQPSLDIWSEGATPNPDVSCNQKIKFHALPEKLLAESSNAWLATGHYARLLPSTLDHRLPALHRASFSAKDQSYYLSTVKTTVLARTMFPLGAFASKDEVRALARQWNIHTSEKQESMGICFVGKRKKFSRFIDSYLTAVPGKIENEQGDVVGEHAGLWNYTIGEGARVSGQRQKMFIGRKDIARNALIIVGADSPVLQCVGLSTSDFLWFGGAHGCPSAVKSTEGLRVQAQTRSLATGSLSNCVVRERHDGSLQIQLETPIVGVSPGQFIVLYDGTWCLGGGTISNTRTQADQFPVPLLPPIETITVST